MMCNIYQSRIVIHVVIISQRVEASQVCSKEIQCDLCTGYICCWILIIEELAPDLEFISKMIEELCS